MEQNDIFADYLNFSHFHISTTPFYSQNNVGWRLEAEKGASNILSGVKGGGSFKL